MKKVLIYNRGEIALRAIRACKELGLKSVALINDHERGTLIEDEASEIIFFNDQINPFMNISLLANIFNQYNISLLYPGYGFLSEDPLLAKICHDHHVVFIGPSIEALAELSSKTSSFDFCKRAGIKNLEIQKPILEDFPLMIKASFGGGGRGNVVCHKIADFEKSVEKLKERSLELFSNDQILFERYLPNARHVELQFVATAKDVYFLSTRDCSLQMNFQKFLEEGPSSIKSQNFLSSLYPSLKRELLTLGYLGVGTIEFLWDESSNCAYFMEVNTRIQVEHPVTELLFDVDLVKIQFEIALNNNIKYHFKQNTKHALCLRVYAFEIQNDDNTRSQIVPAPSTIEYFNLPKFIRFDSHYKAGNNISSLYDPLIGKLIVSGDDRDDCLINLAQALLKMRLAVKYSNLSLISLLLKDSRYLSNQLSVSFFEKEFLNDEIFKALNPSEEIQRDIWQKVPKLKTFEIKKFESYDLYLHDERVYVFLKNPVLFFWLPINPPFWTESIFELEESRYISPISAKVSKIFVRVDDSVVKGQALMVLEAMKTEVIIKALKDGQVQEVNALEGSLVLRGQELIII